MTLAESFPEIIRAHESMGPYTLLRLGGPAEFLVQPRSVAELAAVLTQAAREHIPVRVLGVGSNVLVRDEGVSGIVLRLTAPAFTQIEVDGRKVRAGGGAPLSALISEAARHSLAGLETLVGIAATVGGAVRCNAGDRSGEIGQYVRRVEVLDSRQQSVWREHEELRFSEHGSNLDDPVILTAEFELDSDSADAIVKRMRKTWITRKATQPYSFEAASRVFKNPRGLRAATLIEAAGLKKTRVGGAEVSDRNANYVVASPGATARDVLRLIDLVQAKVREASGVALERDILIW
ncbi:MAG: UDP-N-acetylmuramate dehydrogenase [Gemmataceae bacterium]